MKTLLILIFTQVVSFTFSQTDSSNVCKKCRRPFIDTKIDSTQIFKDEISKLKSDLEKKNKSINSLTIKNNSLQDSLNKSLLVINEINTIWLKDVFVKKFIGDADYFSSRDLVKEDDRNKCRQYDLLSNSLILNKVTGDTLKICHQVLNFNKAYLVLYDVRENVLNQKYDSLKVVNAITQINSIKDLDPSWQLSKTKQLYFDLLSNYRSNVEDLKLELEKRKRNPEQKSDYNIKEYNKLENNPKYNRYPYLLKVIREMKNDVNSYTVDDL